MNLTSKQMFRNFSSDQSALKWAYRECIKSPPKNEPRKRCSISMLAPGREFAPGHTVVLMVQRSHKTEKPKVILRTEDDPYGLAYPLKPDGTHGPWRRDI